MNITNERREDFDKFAKIADDFINKYGNPHTTIIITQAGIEFLQAEMGNPFELRD
jgi:hypothetical protein